RKAVATGIGRMESLQAILERNLETLAVEQADQQTRLVDLDEALKAASVALVRQERQASAGDREERTLGLKAWIATLGARRKTARLRVDAIRGETLELQARLAALGRSRTALGERLRDVDGELQSLSTLRDFRDQVRHQQESRVRDAEERVQNLQDRIAIAEAQAEEAADAPPDADGMSDERGGGEHRVGSVSEAGEPLAGDRVASVRESGETQNRSAGSSMQLDFLPLQGTILFDFGDQDGERKSNGITIAADAGAEIVAPVGGRVVFSGPFKDYGLLLIIDHGNEYHTLLTGFGDIGPREGDIVRAGQMVGRLAERLDSNSRLYLELRYRGMPVNPLPWLAARSDKVRG
ncbi:MAG: peptidoglycan DD-metalloendopeptidase family protein, partial [Geminicoccaceae bacterium]|nr:peptidoglycan DD-metalloendopeptidase family protein [Geminicoccaceae bacterium]